jgi:sRNA-binding regulator protein Hfq
MLELFPHFFGPAFRKDTEMSSQTAFSPISDHPSAPAAGPAMQRKHHRHPGTQVPFRFPAYAADGDIAQRQAELFYLQKQIQSQTPMVIVLEDGELVEGQIEWYDRHTLKVRGRAKTLIYKSAIKYMYKLGEGGQ